jgi:hypothetical protein
VSMREHTSCKAAPHDTAVTEERQGVSIRQHTSAYVSIRQHTSACVSIRQDTSGYVRIRQDTSGYVRIRQDTSGYVSIRTQPSLTSAKASVSKAGRKASKAQMLVVKLGTLRCS